MKEKMSKGKMPMQDKAMKAMVCDMMKKEMPKMMMKMANGMMKPVKAKKGSKKSK